MNISKMSQHYKAKSKQIVQISLVIVILFIIFLAVEIYNSNKHEQQIKELNSSIDEEVQKVENLNEEIEKYKEAIITLQRERNALIAEHKEEVNNYDFELEEFQDKLNEANQLCKEYEEKLNESINKFNELSEKLEKYNLLIEKADADGYSESLKVWLQLKSMGLNDYVASGIMGNIMAEVGGHTLDLSEWRNCSTGVYYGIFQMAGSRKTRLLNDFGTTIDDQLRFFSVELYELIPEGSSFYSLTDEKEAALYFAKKYERCASYTYEVRQRNATKALQYFTT